jgi:RNA polymerase sigma-70 factor (ECF subfamily)
MNIDDQTERFASRAMSVQRQLFAYILTLAPNLIEAEDLLQETNLVLWRKRQEYDASRPMLPWARQIAYYQVLAYRKRLKRDRLYFDDALFEQLATVSEPDAEAAIEQQAALSDCVTKLPAADQQLLRDRYTESLTAAQIGHRLGRSADAIHQAMRRIRLTLLRCVERVFSLETS